MRVAARRGAAALLRTATDSPLLGWAPWIALSVLVGPGRFIFSVLVSLAMSVAFIALDRLRGRHLKVLNVVDAASLLAFLVMGLAVSAATSRWLETWFGEISNLAFVVVCLVSLLASRPITLQYTRETMSRSRWNDPRFLHLNYVITVVWTVAFLVAGLAALHGDAVLHNNNNLWTGWVIQLAAELAAAQFTIWYPRRVETGGADPLGKLLLPLAIYLIPVGIVSIWLGAAPAALGTAFIVVGTAATVWLGQQLLASRLHAPQTAAL